MQGTLKNYYEILGVPRSASTDQIRTAYRKLLLKFHPDKNVGDAYFEDWSKKINEAFEVLMNPEIRSEYDKVYDETKEAWKRASAIEKEAKDAANIQKEEEADILRVDEEIQKLVPVYIASKQAYLKAERNVSGVEAKLRKKKPNRNRQMVVCGAVILLTLLWTGISNIAAFKQPVNAADQVAVPQAVTVSPPRPDPVPENVAAENKETSGFEAVDVWLKVIADKTYFFEKPGEGMMPSRFLSRGNKFHAIKKQGDYYYGIFQSAVNRSYKIEGWIRSGDVEMMVE